MTDEELAAFKASLRAVSTPKLEEFRKEIPTTWTMKITPNTTKAIIARFQSMVRRRQWEKN